MNMKALYTLNLAAVLVVVAGCAATPADAKWTGQYAGEGGGGALPPIQALTNRFTEIHPKVTWKLEDVGSDASMNLTASGDTDIGFTSREFKAGERDRFEVIPVGATGTAVALNAQNPVQNLTKAQVRSIFSGEITDWKDVGGEPGPIRVLVREKTAATRSNFEGYFFDGKPTYSKDVVEVYELEQTMIALGSFKGAIGMTTLSQRTLQNDKIKFVGIDGVAATKANLDNGTYKIRRPMYLIYNKDPAKVKPAIKAFVDFVRGPEGQKVLASV